MIDDHCLGKMHTLRKSALGLCNRLSHEFPMYADILQPVQLALLEMCHGLSVLSTCSGPARQHGLHSIPRTDVARIIAGLMVFPSCSSEGKFTGLLDAVSPSELIKTDHQEIVARVMSTNTETTDRGDCGQPLKVRLEDLWPEYSFELMDQSLCISIHQSEWCGLFILRTNSFQKLPNTLPVLCLCTAHCLISEDIMHVTLEALKSRIFIRNWAMCFAQCWSSGRS